MPAEGLFRVDGGALYDNNVSRAGNSADVRSDWATSLDAVLGTSMLLTDLDVLVLYGHLRHEGYHRYNGLDLLAAGGGLVYSHKFGLGLTEPRFIASVSVDSENFGTSTKDSNVVRASVELRRRMSEVLDLSAGLFYDRRFAENDEPVVPGISGKVFDLTGAGGYATIDYSLTERLLLDVRLALRRGDVVSTTQRGFAIFTASDGIAFDPTFGGDMYYYRLRGTTRTISAALSFALNDHTSLNATYVDESTRAGEGLDYPVRSGYLTIAYRY